MKIDKSISADFRKFIDRELRDERLLWAGKPDPRTAFMGAIIIWLFAVPWSAFSFAWEAKALHDFILQVPKSRGNAGGSFMMVLFGIPFVAIGAAMLSAPWWAARMARRTIYILTDRRLASFTQKHNAISVKSTWPKDIQSVEKTVKADGSGSLKLSFGSKRDSDGDLVETSETLSGIGNVGELERLLVDLRNSPRTSTA